MEKVQILFAQAELPLSPIVVVRKMCLAQGWANGGRAFVIRLKINKKINDKVNINYDNKRVCHSIPFKPF